MAWGAPRGIDDLVERVGRSDPTLASLCVLRMRRVDDDGCRRLAQALEGACALAWQQAATRSCKKRAWGRAAKPAVRMRLAHMACCMTVPHPARLGPNPPCLASPE